MHKHEEFCRIVIRFVAMVLAGVCWLGVGLVVADTPEKTWQWRAIATAELKVTHSVLLQDSIGGDLRRRQLIGPTGLLMSTTSDSCLCEYAFEPQPAEQPAGRIQLQFSGATDLVIVVVAPPEAALLPAQLLRDGPPSGEPGQLVYERRKVLAVEQGQSEDLAAVFLPIEYRHHFERLRPPENAAGFAVREAAETTAADLFGIVDDLGTNKVTLDNAQREIILVEQFKVIRPRKAD
ncbi:MAG: hypothetical protein ACO37F_01550 [Pirellulales bacterium]